MTKLKNPGFETDWSDEKSHDVLICRPGQTPTMETRDNIFTPKSWLAWFYHTPDAPEPDDYNQPEVRDAHKSGDPRRVHSGEKAILLFTFYRKHLAGFFQQVQVTPGQRFRFEAWAHSWSNWNLGPHPDDPRWSEGAHVGYEIVALREGQDGLDDADRNFTFTVGIDPTGGTNPMADTVVWGDSYHVYNGYCKQLSVEATAKGATVTVFLRSKTLYSFKHNDSYWDDATLTQIGDEPPPTYTSTMLVLPQDASPEQLDEVMGIAYPLKRTFGWSHDDAGILGGTAQVYNIPLADRQKYLDWYAANYPGTKVEFAQTSDWDDDGLLLWQCDPRWKDHSFGDSSCGYTICRSGCFITSLAMAQRFYAVDEQATPVTVDETLGPEGYAGCRAVHAAMPEALGLEIVTFYTASIDDWLDSGKAALAEVQPTSLEHFVFVTRRQGERYWMYDPWKNVSTWLDEHYNGVESWRLIEKAEAPVPPPPPDLPLIGLHLQAMQGGALDYVRAVKPRVMKIFQAENAAAIKAASPETLVVLRYFTPDQPLDGDLAKSAWDYVASFADTVRTHAQWIDYVESWNETIPSCNAEAIRRAVEFDVHFADALAARGFGVAPVLLNVAVGNPYHKDGEIELLLPAVAKAVQYGGALGYHSYWLYNDQVQGPDQDWKYFAGRWQEWDKVFVAHGYHPHYIFGECGAFASCNDGWRAGMCCGGDWDKYQAQILEFQSRLVEWNMTHGDRALGGTLFTTCPHWMNWESFRITEPEMIKLARALT